MRSRHPEDFELLCYTAGELEEVENVTIRSHLEACERCALTLTELRQVDDGLRAVVGGETSMEPPDVEALPPNDPFGERPVRAIHTIPGGRELADRAEECARRGGAEVESLLAATAGQAEAIRHFLAGLSFADPAARYLLLYALEEAGRRMSDAPGRFVRFAEEALVRLARERTGVDSSADAEIMVPFSTLVGQAHVLAGQGANWTGELDKARRHFEEAYSTLGWHSESDEVRLALTEFNESQRRSFAGLPAGGLVLARRARRTFERFGLEAFSARARVAEGLALSALGRDDSAIVCFRKAVPVFESNALWTNYSSAMNSLAFSLARLGRLDEARREYSRSLRVVSRERHPALLAYIRNGMAHVLFFAGRYTDAAKSFLQAAGLFQELEQVGDALTANLWEVESWARGGDIARARHRLEIFRAAVGRAEAMDPFIVRQLEQALSGGDPDLQKIAELRQRAEGDLRKKLEARSG